MARKTALQERLDDIRQRISDAAAKARRDAAEITLVAVTKTATPEAVREILQLGVLDLGESRMQVLAQRAGMMNELMARRAALGELPVPKPRWHMVGHLQRNKVRSVLPLVHLVHSVDSLRLAEEIDSAAARLGKPASVLLQVNAAEEAQKFGCAVGAAVHLAEQLDSMPNVQLCGLMTMAPFVAGESAVRQCFSRTRELFEEMRWHKIGGNRLRHLSMGMSNDFEWAIAEGATMVRLGSALFGGEGDHTEDPPET